MTLLPRAAVVDGFLDADLHAALLDHVLVNEHLFTPAKVADNDAGRVDETMRSGLKCRELGPLRARLEAKFREAASSLALGAGTRVPATFSLEFELTASGDSAHFVPHLDIPVGPGRKPFSGIAGADRLLSAVLYFHRQPRAFEGGVLRLLSWSADEQEWRDLEPEDNRLVAFASWARHEVRPVSCPSRRFEDYRFGLNCWFCAPLSA